MDRFHQLQVYVAVAEEEGFAAAARRLQLSPPAVTRAVASLEDTLGVKLLDRTTRYVRATEAGRRYLADARQILAGLEAADEAAVGINGEPRGHLAVMPGIVEYLARYPAMEVEAGSLQILMPQFEPREYPVHILLRESRHASARVRAFIDLLAERLRGDKTLNAQEK